ncbi:MAG: DUF1460 domain-containing protein [Prevotella sp.]|nr:DUF1460 domain-containing protein [Prevotella sp.]
MRRVLIACLLGIVQLSVSAQVQYLREDSVRVMQLLDEAPRNGNLLVHFARQLKEIPYVAHTLEPNDKERLIINLRELDCTTMVENALALSLCVRDSLYSFEAFCHILQKIRYIQGDEPAYVKRLHYFTSWIEDNTAMGFCREIQSPNPPFTAQQTIQVNYMTQHPDLYRMLKVNPSDIPGIREQEQAINGRQYRYIPQEQLTNTALLRRTIHDGDIIAIITTIAGLDTQHIGIAVWHDDGLHLLNASSIHHKVVEEPMTLRQYLFQHKTMPGIRIIRPNM